VNTNTQLPGEDDAGTEGVWTFTDQYNETFTVTGTFLGVGSSHRPRHKGHEAGTFIPRREHCSTCRWTEIRIFVEAGERTRYAVVNRGVSIVPGERELVTCERFTTGFSVVEGVTTRKTQRDGSQVVALTLPAARALAQAAAHDESIRDAYVNRATV
jgi:hypothetical protein